MTGSDPLLDRAAIEDALGRLGDRLAPRGAEVIRLCAEVFPDERPPDRVTLILEDLFEGRDAGAES
jgi:hypothetical protein